MVDWAPTRDAPTGGPGRGLRNDSISFMGGRVAGDVTGRQAGMSGGLRVGRQDFLRELDSTPSAQSYFIKDGEGLSRQKRERG